MFKSFKERIAALKATRSYCQEQAKLEFVGGVTRLMQSKHINNASLAERMQTSPAYVTKILRGDVNFTIESMVKVTHALGGRFHIHVADSEANVRWLEHFTCAGLSQTTQPMPPQGEQVLSIDIARFLNETENEGRQIYA
ncbi:helix-turn-helix domain-containing protein [Pseudomonas brassicacearum]|uniref:helix-turn-helix domain-containing protein n=1 Tax=Pseudomonas TaxID=286 RepID=UPI0005B355D4|nr:helix-turn-helix domain-containing protein [Pseudomonas brassicacearum]